MKGNHARIVIGFSMLCCVNVICFFPDALAPWASTEWLRTYNTYARPAECLSLVAIAVFAFKVPRRIGMVGVAIGYVGLLCGLCAPAILGSNVETSVLAGILCGMGLAPTMMFWFAFLTEFTERHQAIVQGWQALVGECLFLGVSIFFDAGVIPACILTVASATCALRVDSSRLFSENGKTDASIKNLLSLGKTDWLAPCTGYLIASLAYGALMALSRGAEGETASEIASAIGRPHRSSLLHRLGDSQQAPRLRSRLRMGRGGIRRRMPTARQCDRAIFFRLFPNNGPFALFVIHRPSFSHAARSHSVHSERLRNIAFAVFLRPLPPRRPWSYKRQRHCSARSSMDRLRNRFDSIHCSYMENERHPH